MEDVVIVDAVRTAIGKFGGTLAGIPAHTLGSRVIAALLERTGMDAARVDEVIMGQVLTAGTGQNPARQAAIAAGALGFLIPVVIVTFALRKYLLRGVTFGAVRQ